MLFRSFRCWGVTQTCASKAIDLIHVAVIENAECLRIRLRSLDEKTLILVHAWSLGRGQGSVITEFTDCEEGGRGDG